MIHQGQQLEREIERYKRELQTPIDDNRRRAVEAAINQLRRDLESWKRPH